MSRLCGLDTKRPPDLSPNGLVVRHCHSHLTPITAPIPRAADTRPAVRRLRHRRSRASCLVRLPDRYRRPSPQQPVPTPGRQQFPAGAQSDVVTEHARLRVKQVTCDRRLAARNKAVTDAGARIGDVAVSVAALPDAPRRRDPRKASWCCSRAARRAAGRRRGCGVGPPLSIITPPFNEPRML